MILDLAAAIQRQWADDEEYIETCRFIEMELEAKWQIEARLRASEVIPAFLQEKLRREWQMVLVTPTPGSGEELILRREQPLTTDAVKPMSASLLRLAHTYNLDWLNWSEFDGFGYRSLHRSLDWVFDPAS